MQFFFTATWMHSLSTFLLCCRMSLKYYYFSIKVPTIQRPKALYGILIVFYVRVFPTLVWRLSVIHSFLLRLLDLTRLWLHLAGYKLHAIWCKVTTDHAYPLFVALLAGVTLQSLPHNRVSGRRLCTVITKFPRHVDVSHPMTESPLLWQSLRSRCDSISSVTESPSRQAMSIPAVWCRRAAVVAVLEYGEVATAWRLWHLTRQGCS